MNEWQHTRMRTVHCQGVDAERDMVASACTRLELFWSLPTPAMADNVGRAFGCVCEFVYLSMCLFVRGLDGNGLAYQHPSRL